MPAKRDRGPWAKRTTRLAGQALMVVALAYLIGEGWRNWSKLSTWRPDIEDLEVVAGVSLLYGASLFLLAENWHRIVGIFGREGRRRTYRSYTMTQIAKYIPGNFAHLLSRAIYLRGGSLSDVQLGKATLLEMACMPAAAGAFIVLAGGFLPLAEIAPSAAWLVCVPVPAAIGLAAAVATALAYPWPEPARAVLQTVVVTTATATIFMGLLGLSFAILADAVTPTPVLYGAAAAVIGWLVGYLTPGAPGGLGTREAVMLVLLRQELPETEALTSIVLFRFVTVIGDVLCFLGGSALFHVQGRSRRVG